MRLAASFGAGLVLDGAVVEVGRRLLVNALLRRAPSGEEVARATTEVAVDSLQVLPQRLLMQLLGNQLGEGAERLSTLARQDPGAVKAYMAGAHAHRTGRYREAIRHFEDALGRDSTFALAAYRLALSARMSMDQPRFMRLVPVLEGLTPALSGRDRAGAAAMVAFWSDVGTFAGIHAATHAWVEAAPEDPAAWLHLAETSMKASVLGIPDWQAQADRAFNEAWALDSTTPWVVQRHVWVAQQTGHLDWLRQVGPRFLAVADTAGDWWPAHRWAIAVALGDSGTVQSLRAAAVAGDARVAAPLVAHALAALTLAADLPVDDAELVNAAALRAARTSVDSGAVRGARLAIDAARGRAHELESGLLGEPPWGYHAAVWYLPAYPGLDSAAVVAVESLRVFLRSGSAREITPGGDVRDSASVWCSLGLYGALVGDTLTAKSLARDLGARLRQEGIVSLCPVLVEALTDATSTSGPGAQVLDSLEVLFRLGPPEPYPASTPLLLARLLRQRGEYARALDVVRSRFRGWGFDFMMRAPLLKEEGDLGAILGDTAAAIRAYERYLTYRTDPDPGVMTAEVERVRAALNALLKAKG
jgi:tetratricopeptide (TPR) repeat protein